MAIDDIAFRREVREFLQHHLPPAMAARGKTVVHPTGADSREWGSILSRVGWSVPGWPAEWGGSGWTGRQRQVYEEEALLAGAPPFHIQSVFLAGPMIVEFGSAEQKQKWLPPICEGKALWAQGFSEPDSGSDLASLRTKAVRDGDHYVINGQKIWTSDAYFCDNMFCLARTDPDEKPQRGISMFLFPLDLPGITIRQIPQIDAAQSLCEVFFDNVRVPLDALLGEEGKGWTYAKFLLDNERATTAEVPRNRRELNRLTGILADLKDEASRRSGRHRLAELEVDFAALETGVAALLDQPHGEPVGLGPSLLKVQGTELMQASLEASVQHLGLYGVAEYQLGEEATASVGPVSAPGTSGEFLFRRAATIYGGSTEIQFEIVSRAVAQAEIDMFDAAVGEDASMVRDSIRAYARRRSGPDEWATLAENGWLMATLPEGCGGLGWTPEDGAVIMEELGRARVSQPVVEQLMAARTLALSGSGEHLAIAEGWVVGATALAFAHEEEGERFNPVPQATIATRKGDGWSVAGRKVAVVGAADAEAIVVTAQFEGRGVAFLVRADTPGLELAPYVLIDGTAVADIVLDITLPADALIVGAGQDPLACALEHGLVDYCAQAVGAMLAAFWITRDYLAERKQFGRPLLEFQVLRHRLARMALELARARSILDYGIAALALPDADARQVRLSAMKSRIGRSGFHVAAQAFQLHGGIAITSEYALGGYFTRLKVLEARLGSPASHLEAVAERLEFLAPAGVALS